MGGVPLGEHINSLQGPEDGATAAEYALLVALISAVIAAAVAAVGTAVLTAFGNFSTAFQAAVN